MPTFEIKMGRISTKIVTYSVEAECEELAIEKAYEMSGDFDYNADGVEGGVEYELYTIDGVFPDNQRNQY